MGLEVCVGSVGDGGWCGGGDGGDDGWGRRGMGGGGVV